MPAPIPTETVRTQSERKASPTARGPWPRSQSETTPKTTRNGVALNGRIPANPATRIAAATRSSGRRNRRSRRASRKPPGVTPMPEDPMDRGDYHTVGHRTKPLPHHRQTGLFRPWDRTTSWTVRTFFLAFAVRSATFSEPLANPEKAEAGLSARPHALYIDSLPSSPREREQVAPGAVIEPTEVAPDDHGVGAARWRGHGDLRRRPRTWSAVPEEHAGRGYQPHPGSKVRRHRGYRAHAQRDVVALCSRERPRIKVALVDAAGIRGPVGHGTTFVARGDDDRARPLREREQVAPGAVIEPTEVAPDDHGVRTARWRGRGDIRRPGLSRTVPEERAGRRHQPDPGSEVRRCLRYRAHAQRDVVTLCSRERPRIKVALVDAAGIRGPVGHGTAFVTRRELDRARPLRERELVAPGAVIEPTEVAPDDHGVRTARGRGRGDVRRPGLSKAVPEQRAGRGHQPDPGSEVRRCLRYRAHAQRDVVTLCSRERPRIKVALVDAAGIRGPVGHGTTFVARGDDDRARPLRERELVAPGAVIEPIEVAPDDHGVRTARGRGRGDVRRPGLSRTVPEQHAGRG